MFLYEDAVRKVVPVEFVDGLYRRDSQWEDGPASREKGFVNFWLRGVEARLGVRVFEEGRDLSVGPEDGTYSWRVSGTLTDGGVCLAARDNDGVSSVLGVFSEGELRAVVECLKVKARVEGDGFRVLYAPSYTSASRKNNASALLQRRR